MSQIGVSGKAVSGRYRSGLAEIAAWILVGALWVVGCLNYLDRQIIFSVFPLLQSELKISALELGLLSTAFLWIYGILSPLAGFLADRFGRQRVIVFSLLVWSAVTLATGLVQNYPQLITARALMGISEACYLPAALALITERHGRGSRSLATGIHSSGIYFGMIVGGGAGGWLGEEYGWRFAFRLLGIIGIIYVPVLLFVFRRSKETATVSRSAAPALGRSLRELSRLRGFGALTGTFAATSVANWIVYTWMPFYLYERYHLTLAKAGLVATGYLQAASVAGILVGGLLADRWSRSSRRGRLWTQALGLSISAPTLALVGYTAAYPALIGGLVLFGFGKGLYDCNAMPVLAQIARTEIRATGYGIFNCAGNLAGGVVAPLAGALRGSLGIGGCMVGAGVVLLCGAAALLTVRIPENSYDEYRPATV
jgi:MFS family permease